jgi:simple sugar transport system ATP-binding protein
VSDAVGSVRNLSKSYGGVQALSDLDIEVRAGEVLAVVGDNGAGKTTLIKCVAGIVRPDGGEISVGDATFDSLTPEQARTAGIEVVHQHLGLIDLLDVAENLFANREIVATDPIRRTIGWLDWRSMYTEAAKTLEDFGLAFGPLTRPVRELSGGQRQMLAILRAVHWTPRMVMMDEPTAALGVEQSIRVLELVQTLASRGIAVLLVSHNMQHVFQVAHRIVVLRHGKKVAEGDRASMTFDDVIAHITGSRALLASLHAGADRAGTP